MHRLILRFITLLSLVILVVATVSAMPPSPALEARIRAGLPNPLGTPQQIRERMARGVDAPNRVGMTSATDEVYFNILVVLVDFSDQVHQTPASYFDHLMFDTTRGSLHHYWRSATYGNLRIQTQNLPSSIGWIRAPMPYSYYVGTDHGTGAYPNNSQALVEDIVDSINARINFALYDHDGNGYVDGLFIVHSGTGAESSGDSTDIWSHAWNITPRLVDGVRVRNYSIEPEFWEYSSDMTCGVYAHEMGHAVFGVPDWYDRDYTSRGLGRWSLMAGGSWNGNLGNSPAYFDAYSRYVAGLVIPTEIYGTSNNLSIPAIENTATTFMLRSQDVNDPEYYLIENRQLMGYDTTLPGSGLLIYHIDTTVTSQDDHEWYPTYSDSGHYRVALEQADGLYELERDQSSGNSGDPWPGSTNNRSFSQMSTPNTSSYHGVNTQVMVTNISNSGNTMTATLSTNSSQSAIVVVYPTGGEIFTANTQQTIEWASDNYNGNVNIAIQRASGGAWETIATNIPVATGQYDWLVTGPMSTTAKIKVVATDISVGGQSAAVFTIRDVVLYAPAAGDVWSIGSAHAITWDATINTQLMTIEINRDYPSGNWDTIATNTVNDGWEVWTVTGPISTTARVRVRSQNSANIAYSSGNMSIIYPVPTVLIPNGGENWIANTTHEVSWNPNSGTGNARISINRDYPNGVWQTLVTSIPNTGSWSWVVNGPATSNARIRVTNTPGSSNDISDTSFIIRTMAITSPNSAVTWNSGSSHQITWNANGCTDSVSIDINRSYPSGSWEPLFTNIANTGTIAWTVTGPTTSVARIRVRTGNSNNLDESDTNFTVISTDPTFIFPAGGESFTAGTTQTVTWNPNGSTGTVRIQINRNYPIGSWATLVAAAANNGSWSWNVAGPRTTSARLRLTTSDSGYTGVTYSNFTIRDVALYTPNGGENWTIGSQQLISWDSSIVNVPMTIDINRNYPNGTWETIITNAVNSGWRFWTVTGPSSSIARIRVRSSNSRNIATSEANFTIVNGVPRLTFPVGYELLTAGQDSVITWVNNGNSELVRLELNRNYPSGTWELLADSVTNTGRWNWQISGPLSPQSRVRLSTLTSHLSCISDNNFRIRDLSVYAPNGRENWVIGTQQMIFWDSTIVNVPMTIELNRNYPAGSWEQLYTNTTNDGWESWTVVGPASTNSRIRIRSANGRNFDISDSNFSITAGTPRISFPVGGELLTAGRDTVVTWVSNGNTDLIRIELNRSYPTGTWERLADSLPNNGRWNWSINGPRAVSGRVRIVTIPGNVVSMSGYEFSIRDIVVYVPNGHEDWATGTIHQIFWDSTTTTLPVTIELNRNYPTGTWESLFTNVTNSGWHNWTTSGTATQSARIRIRTANNRCFDVSDSNFTIHYTNPALGFPYSSDVVVAGTTRAITWTTAGLPGYVRLQLNRSYPSTSWTTLADSIPNNGSWNWQISGPNTTTARIRLISLVSGLIDTSDGNFLINDIRLTAPIGGANWFIGNTESIVWNVNSTTQPLIIELNRTYPSGTWESIAQNATNNGAYQWLVTGPVTQTARIRIRSSNNLNTAVGTANFSISIGTPVLTAPNILDTLTAGSRTNITWLPHGNASLIRIQLNRNYPSGTWGTIVDSIANSGSYSWLVTGPMTNNARMRITTITGGLTDVTDSTFTIRDLRIIAPNGGEYFTGGDHVTIRWAGNGIAATQLSIDLNRSYPNGQWETIISNTPNDGSEIWTATASEGTLNARIRIRSTDLSNIDISDTNFTLIQGNGVVLNEMSGIPTEYQLLPSYPNPFNNSTTIRFGVPHQGNVRIRIINANGQTIATLLEQSFRPGYYTTRWEAKRVSSGSYFAIMEVNNIIKKQPLLLIK